MAFAGALGPVAAYSADAVSFEFSEFRAAIAPAIVDGLPVSGILGADFLSRFRLVFDSANAQLLLFDPLSRQTQSSRNAAFSSQGVAPPHVGVRVAGRPATALIDTGLAGSLLLSEDWLTASGLLNGRRPARGWVITPSSETPIGQFRVDSVDLAGRRFTSVPALVLPDWKFDTPIVVGVDLLKRGRLEIDYKRETLSLSQPLAAFFSALPANRTGIWGYVAHDSYLVRRISEGSPADLAGWARGDAVVAINGRKIDRNFIPDFDILGPRGSTVRFQMASGETRVLRLQDYF